MEPDCAPGTAAIFLFSSRPCVVCGKEAYHNNFGALTCDACKMFFRRAILLGKEYSCNPADGFLKSTGMHVKCCSCRLKKCLEVGMNPQRLAKLKVEIDAKTRKLGTTMKELLWRDKKRQGNLMNFYSTDNLNLETIVWNPNLVRKMRRDPNYLVTPDEWAYLALYSHTVYFLQFDFVKQLSFEDKIKVFKFNMLPLAYFAGLMRTKNEKGDYMYSPGGQSIYPIALQNEYKDNHLPLTTLCSEPVSRLLELDVTDEEYCLMNIIFFCNPGLQGLSEAGSEILHTEHRKYFAFLLEHCKQKHPKSFIQRITDLMSFHSKIINNASAMEGLFSLFLANKPNYKFYMLIEDSFHL
ncbi:Protein CBG10264 [Caenorhabditis briggsae]|uniref:Protein CBG10264 n=1 Tax=Caenorhabditis briggsae TaxID=6238 RepID=A8XAR2_CAEBR|nr:Protein CBG10264 [Caenorhabditis briggsae]CAP29727.1 Protein CBG10264 [Caenorhabditis briggsae]